MSVTTPVVETGERHCGQDLKRPTDIYEEAHYNVEAYEQQMGIGNVCNNSCGEYLPVCFGSANMNINSYKFNTGTYRGPKEYMHRLLFSRMNCKPAHCTLILSAPSQTRIPSSKELYTSWLTTTMLVDD